MAAIVWSDVTALAPELTSTSATTQSDILNHVNAAIDVDRFDGEDGPTTRLARIYLAAHYATLAALGAGGPLAVEREGGIERSYAAPSQRSELLTTSYGRGFWQLIRPVAHGPIVL